MDENAEMKSRHSFQKYCVFPKSRSLRLDQRALWSSSFKESHYGTTTPFFFVATSGRAPVTAPRHSTHCALERRKTTLTRALSHTHSGELCLVLMDTNVDEENSLCAL